MYDTAIEMAKRLLVDSIWKSANLEGLGTTFPKTEAILSNAPTETKSEEVLFVINMKRAWQFLLDNLDSPNNIMLLREYNKVVGERTYANGFKDAHVFSGGKVVDGLGGGICQISSTLYNAVLMANLEVTERKNHMMYPEYVKPSLDATVVWGSIDFRFKNNRETPIKIVATVKNGIATTTIYGKKLENEPIVEIESVIEKTIPYTTVTEYDNTMEEGKSIVTQDPVNGYVSKAYKIIKDQSGKEISRTLISSDTYRQTSKIITVGTKKVENTVVNPSEPNKNTETPIDNSENTNNNIEDNSSEWPTGWDTPENPYYTGNN